MDSKGHPETKRLKTGESEQASPEMENAQKSVNYQSVGLPEEILEMIFSNLSDSKDLMAVSNATPQFNRILKPSCPSWAFNKVFPLIFSELGKDDILNCRLVCKEWNKSVDNFLQAQPSERRMAIYQPRPVDRSEKGDTTGSNHPAHRPQYQQYLASKDLHMAFRDSNRIRTVMEEMKSHPRNPFLLRNVGFDNSFSEGEEYWTAAIMFLTKFGQHIWHVSMGPSLNSDERFHIAHNYSILRQALTFMPNLRTLTVDGFYEDPLGHFATRSKIDWVADYIRLNPLPELPYLHTLSEFLPEGPNPVMIELMQKYSGQLKKVMARPYVWLKEPPEIGNLPVTQATDLELIFGGCICTWRRLCRTLVAPNLAKLKLIIWDSWEMAKLLQPLREGLPSLVYLGLGFRTRSRNFTSTDPPEFALERIKTLEIEDRSFVQYDHILNHLPGLEYVLVCHNRVWRSIRVEQVDPNEEEEEEESDGGERLEMDNDESDEDGEEMQEEEEMNDEEQLEIRRLMLAGKMYESDIWTRLRFLKEFTFAIMGDTGETENEIATKKLYTREVYNQKLGQ